MWRVMEELTLKTESLHATELRAQIAEKKWMELQMTMVQDRMRMANQLRACSTTEETLAAQLAMLQLQQGCGMPLKIGMQQPAVNPWSLAGPNAYPTVPLDQSVPLKVGPVLPQRHEVVSPGKPKKKAGSMAEAGGAGAGLLSRGSKNHAQDRCRPCSFFFSAGGCPEGASCNFCHYPHSEAKLMEAAMYSAKAAEKRALQKSRGKWAQADTSAAASPPPPSAVPQPNVIANRRNSSKGTQSTKSIIPPTLQAGDPIWSVTVEL